MARRYQTTDAVITAIMSDMIADGGYSPKTIHHMGEHCRIVKRYLDDTNLYDISAEDVRNIHNLMVADGLAVSTQKSYMFALFAMLRRINNPSYNTRIVYQADTRPRVDWLTPEQAHTVLESPVISSIQRLAVVLALCFSLSRLLAR